MNKQYRPTVQTSLAHVEYMLEKNVFSIQEQGSSPMGPILFSSTVNQRAPGAYVASQQDTAGASLKFPDPLAGGLPSSQARASFRDQTGMSSNKPTSIKDQLKGQKQNNKAL